MGQRTGSTRVPPTDVVELLQQQIDALKQDVARMKNNRVVTVPIYDSTNFPAQAVEGQLAIAPIV